MSHVPTQKQLSRPPTHCGRKSGRALAAVFRKEGCWTHRHASSSRAFPLSGILSPPSPCLGRKGFTDLDTLALLGPAIPPLALLAAGLAFAFLTPFCALFRGAGRGKGRSEQRCELQRDTSGGLQLPTGTAQETLAHMSASQESPPSHLDTFARRGGEEAV